MKRNHINTYTKFMILSRSWSVLYNGIFRKNMKYWRIEKKLGIIVNIFVVKDLRRSFSWRHIYRKILVLLISQKVHWVCFRIYQVTYDKFIFLRNMYQKRSCRHTCETSDKCCFQLHIDLRASKIVCRKLKSLYSKIVLPQLYTMCIFHDIFCLVFLIDLLAYPY